MEDGDLKSGLEEQKCIWIAERETTLSEDAEANEQVCLWRWTTQEVRLVVSEGEMWPTFLALYHFHLKK